MQHDQHRGNDDTTGRRQHDRRATSGSGGARGERPAAGSGGARGGRPAAGAGSSGGRADHRTGPGPHRPGGAGPRLTPATARRALRREIPGTLALRTAGDDFHAMRAYTTFAFDDHPAYLRHAHALLRSLTAHGTHVDVVRFDPARYAAWCAESGREPDDPDTRTRYVADVAATGAAVPFAGQPLDDLVEGVDLAADRHATWTHAADALAATGRADACFDRACTALTRLFDAAGPGEHHLVCSVPLDDAPLIAVLHAHRAPDGTVDVAEADALTLATLLAAGMATGTPGGLVLRTGDGTPDAPDHVRGWTLRDQWLHPLTEAQVFAAYCTDADTGDPVPPEPGVTYRAGLPLTPPHA